MPAGNRRHDKPIPLVSPLELGVAFSLFQTAVLGEFLCVPVRPLTSAYVNFCCEDETALERGWAILSIHYDYPDVRNSIMQRINCFVLLLKRVHRHPARDWKDFVQRYDRFVPILHAVAWCPAFLDKPFDQGDFIRIAQNAPAEVSQSPLVTM
jgi:hypothetical protein